MIIEKIKQTIPPIFLIICLLGLSGELLAQTPDAKLQQVLLQLNTMQASFSQVIFDERGNMIQQSSGKMALSRPGKFRWETKRPIAQLIITDDKQLLIYDPDLEQLQIKSLRGELGRTPAILLTSDEKSVTDDYQIQLRQSNKQARYTLRPKYDDSNFSHLELSFEGLSLVKMQLWDRLGQKTEIKFTHIKVNQPVSPSLFRFSPPPGVDIVR